MDPIGIIGAVSAAARLLEGFWPLSSSKDTSTRRQRFDTGYPRGLSISECPESPEIDICLVHGLAGDAKSTWTAHIPETGEQLFWPTKLLASQHSTNSTFPKARIMLYGYETSVNSLSWLTERTLYYHANHLLDQLIQKRKDNRDRPLFFIAHSLGGLLVKNALIFARAVGNPSDTEAREIYLSTFGIVSFGTPQTFVGNAPLEDMIERLCQYLRDYVGSDDSIRRLTFEDFDSGKDWVKYVDRLQRRLNQYKPLAKEIPEMFCYESSENIYLNRQPISTKRMTTPPKREFVHPSCRRLSIKRSHLEMPKFSKCDNDFMEICNFVLTCHKESRISLPKRRTELFRTRERPMLRGGIVRDFGFFIDMKLPEKTASTVARTLSPSREYHLKTLEEQVQRSRCVVLAGRAATGKTALALEYAHLHKHLNGDQYCSVFWLNAQSRPSLESSFMEIVVKLRTRYRETTDRDSKSGSNVETIHALQNVQLDEGQVPIRAEDRKFAVHAVLEWLSYPENKRWLLIYDDVQDVGAPYLREFIPPEYGRGHIIMTCRNGHITSSGADKDQIDFIPFYQDKREPYFPVNTNIQNNGQGGVDRAGLDTSHHGAMYGDPTKSLPPERPPFMSTNSSEDCYDSCSSSERRQVYQSPIRASTMKGDEVVAETGHMPEPGDANVIEYAFYDSPEIRLSGDSDLLNPAQIAEDELKEGLQLMEDIPETLAPWIDVCAMLSPDPIPILLLQLNFRMEEEDILTSLHELQNINWVTVDSESKTFQIPETCRRVREQMTFDSNHARQACNFVIGTVKHLDDYRKRYDYLGRATYERILLKHIPACLDHYSKYGKLINCEWDVLAELCEQHGLYDEAQKFYQAVSGQGFDNSDTMSHISVDPHRLQANDALNGRDHDTTSSISDEIWNNPPESRFSDEGSPDQLHVSSFHDETKTSRAWRSKIGLMRTQLKLKLHQLKGLGSEEDVVYFQELGDRCQDIMDTVRHRHEVLQQVRDPHAVNYLSLRIETLQLMVLLKKTQNEWMDAVRFSDELTNLLEKHHGPSADCTVEANLQCADIHIEHHDYKGAVPVLEQVIMTYEQSLGGSHPRTIAVVGQLAEAYKHQGEVVKARELYSMIVEANRHRLAEDHIETAKAKEQLGTVYEMTEEYPRADEQYNAALYAAKLLGEENPEYEKMLERHRERRERRDQDTSRLM